MGNWNRRAGQVVQACLQIDPEAIPNVTLIDELASVSRMTAANVPAVGSSAGADALTGDDAEFWGEGIGYLFSAGVRRILPKRVPTGEAVKLDLGTNKFEFSAPPPYLGQKPIEQVWIEAAWDRITLIGAVKAEFDLLRATSLFVATGPRRALEAQGRYTTFNPLFNLMQDLLQAEAVFLQNEAAWALWDIR